jgi:MFS family permease
LAASQDVRNGLLDRLARRLQAMLPEPGIGRWLGIMALLNAVGTGMWLSGSIVFFTQLLHVAPWQVGVGLSAAGAAALLSAVPLGRIADRLGPRRFLATTNTVQGLLYVVYPLAHGFVAFLAVVVAIAAISSANQPARSALTKGLLGRDGAVRNSAFQRAIFNIGFAVGTLLALVALTIGTPPAYAALAIGNAVSFAVSIAMVLRLPDPPGAALAPRRGSGWRSPVRDGAVLGLALVGAVLSLHATLLTVGLPIFILTQTNAPKNVIPLLFIVNPIVVVLFQVRLSRDTHHLAGAVRALRLAALALIASCVLVVAATFSSAYVVAAAAVLAAIGFALAEVLQTAGAFGLALALTPEGRESEYFATYSLGVQAEQTTGPALVTTIVTRLGVIGWIPLGAMFVAAALAVGPLTRAASRGREEAGAPARTE